MTQISSRGGRRPKTDPSVNRYVVRFNAEENAKFLAMFDRSGLESRGAFIIWIRPLIRTSLRYDVLQHNFVAKTVTILCLNLSILHS